MNEELTELQRIWQEYPRKNKRSREVIREIKRLDHREKIKNLIKTGVFLVTIGFLIFIFLQFQFTSTLANIGFAILCASILVHASLIWWIQAIKYEEKIKKSMKQVFEPALHKLTLKKNLIRYFIPLLAIELGTGINLIYLEIFSGYGLLFRLLIHGLITSLLLLVFYRGWLRHLKKMRDIIDPLILKIKDEQKKLTLEL